MSRCFLALAILLVCPISLCADESADLVELAANGLRQTREQISSLHARYKVDMFDEGKPVRKYRAEWWEQGVNIRWKHDSDVFYDVVLEGESKPKWRKEKADVLYKNHRATVVKSRAIPDMSGPNVAQVGDIFPCEAGGCSLWASAGFILLDTPEISLLDALQSPQWRKSAKWVTVNEGKGKYLFVEAGNGDNKEPRSFQVFLDPQHSFLPARLIVFFYLGSFDARKLHVETQVIRFHSPSKTADVCFPAEVRRRFLSNAASAPFAEWKVVFDPVEINARIPPETFQLVIPAGYPVTDLVTGERYKMGKDGKREQPAPLFDFRAHMQRPKESYGWVWGIVAAVAGVCAVGWIFFKTRRRRA